VTLVELVVTQGSPLVGRTVRESTIRALQGSTVMAVERRGSHLRAGIADLHLAAGDTLLVQTETSRLPQFRGSEDFVLLEGLHEELTLKRKAPWVLAVTVALVVLASTDILDVSFLAVAAAVTLVVTKCLTVRQAHRSLDMTTLILMGSTIAFGTALEKSGAAAWLSAHVLDLARVASPEGYEAYAALGACYLLCNVLTAFASNSAAALLVLPIALRAATELGVSDRPFVFAVAFAASLDFATPTGYQTNLLVYGPGGYRYSDYLKFGGLLNVIFLGLAIVLLPAFFPF
jgi:di/tricarboxylate transporter